MDSLSNYNNVTEEIRSGLLRRTENAVKKGILPDNIVWDPGLGFAKNTEQNLTLLREIEIICAEGFPVLVGPSRKRFIGSVLDQPNPESRVWGSAAIACRCLQAKVSMLRVHDVYPIQQTIRMAKTIFR